MKSQGMAFDFTILERVARALHDHDSLEWEYDTPGAGISRGHRLEQARAALAGLGLEDWEAAVDRAGDALADECQDRYGFRPALGQRDILAEIVLRAALTATGEGEASDG